MRNIASQILSLLLVPASLTVVRADEGQPVPSTGAAAPAGVAVDSVATPGQNAALNEALAQLKLPGIAINVEEWSVDVSATVALKDGLLELIACTPETKVHESILSIAAKPSHVHTALLLLGAKPGNPAMVEPLDEDQTVFRHLPPQGGLVDVYLVIPGKDGELVERPINDFITMRDDDEFAHDPADRAEEADQTFSTHSFVFAGSHLVGEEGEEQRYLADISGHVISITTFGDELLCLPGFHEHANEALMWQVAGDDLPAVDEKIILRLRPQMNRPAAAADVGPEEEPTLSEPVEQPAGTKPAAAQP